MRTDEHLVFVDTNILVYAHDSSGGVKTERARGIIEELWDSGEGCLSIQVLQEFFVTVTRKVPHPLPARRAAKIVEDLAGWRVHSPGPEDVLASIEIHLKRRISLWDALIIRSAVQLGCREILSEDLNPGPLQPGLSLRNPLVS